MNKKEKNIYLFIFIISCILSGFYNWELNVSDIITFISLIMGFQIAAFSLLFYSRVVQDLYHTKSISNPNITLKHELKNYYKVSFNTSLITIVLILVIPDSILKQKISFMSIFINSYMFYVTNNFLYRIFLKENGNNDKK